MMNLVLLWTSWCALHSLLISRPFQAAAAGMMGRRFPLYRLLYVALSCVTLVPVLLYQLWLPAQVLVAPTFVWRAGQALLLLYGGYMMLAGARSYDMAYFLGLRQLRAFRHREEPPPPALKTEGILARVRHPWYSGGIALVWGVGTCTDVYLASRVVLTAYFLVGTLLEEARLKRELGEPYLAYCRRVPMLIPRLGGTGE
ncbi:MAG: isoprenylcysteine carboxylmethyltransferase family protein [Desulfobulbaceae bacterium]